MFKFDQQTNFQSIDVDGLLPWKWRAEDTQTFPIIHRDWTHSHRNKLLKHIPVNRRRDVVCAGGNQGLYPRLLSEIFENVYTFEPDPLSFHCLAANCQKSNIVKIQAALGRERGLVQMQCMSPANTGMNRVQPGGNIPMLRLDDFAFAHLDLIFFDMELSELPALQGAEQTIAAHRPVIWAEYTLETGDVVKEWLAEKCNYKCIDKSEMDRIYVFKE